MTRTSRWTLLALVVAVAAGAAHLRLRGTFPPEYAPRPEDDELQAPEGQGDGFREEALRTAKVWRLPAHPVGEAALDANPPQSFDTTDEVTCRFLPKSSEGYSPKFQCVLAGGEVVKIKYGRNSPEVYAEVAATRLLSALGFGADQLSVVRRVRCSGCPSFPYPRVGLMDAFFTDYGRVRTFETAVIEQRFAGKEIKGDTVEGFGLYELDKIDPARGASRAEVDALRLMAVFLSHWDSKASNQRLVCLPGGESASAPCARSFAMLHDVGRTFGPRAIDLESWSRSPVWSDLATCRVSMKHLPYGGATFQETTISEGGRCLLGGLLVQLRPDQIRALFAGARFPAYPRHSGQGRDAGAWVRAFEDRVRQIVDRPPCPLP